MAGCAKGMAPADQRSTTRQRALQFSYPGPSHASCKRTPVSRFHSGGVPFAASVLAVPNPPSKEAVLGWPPAGTNGFRSVLSPSNRLRASSWLLANRRWLLRRCRMILPVLSQDRLKGFLWPKFRNADFVQTGSVPI